MIFAIVITILFWTDYRTYTITDEYGKLDYWSYESYGGLYFDNDKLIKIHANSITDRQ